MKRSKRLYVLSGVLAVICVVTFRVSRYEQRKEEIKNSDEIILELAAEDVTALSWEYDETKLAFHKSETWLYDDDEAFPVSEEKMNDLLGLFESFGVSFIIENVEDYSQYGLDDPTCSIHIETAEESYEVHWAATVPWMSRGTFPLGTVMYIWYLQIPWKLMRLS